MTEGQNTKKKKEKEKEKEKDIKQGSESKKAGGIDSSSYYQIQKQMSTFMDSTLKEMKTGSSDLTLKMLKSGYDQIEYISEAFKVIIFN
jgi:hypothetical protein